MNQPVLKNLAEAILHPEEHQEELKAYEAAKRPAEELLAKQRKALDEFFKTRR